MCQASARAAPEQQLGAGAQRARHLAQRARHGLWCDRRQHKDHGAHVHTASWHIGGQVISCRHASMWRYMCTVEQPAAPLEQRGCRHARRVGKLRLPCIGNRKQGRRSLRAPRSAASMSCTSDAAPAIALPCLWRNQAMSMMCRVPRSPPPPTCDIGHKGLDAPAGGVLRVLQHELHGGRRKVAGIHKHFGVQVQQGVYGVAHAAAHLQPARAWTARAGGSAWVGHPSCRGAQQQQQQGPPWCCNS